MIQNIIFVVSHISYLAYNFSPHVLADIKVFFIPDFVAENLKANKN